MLSKDEKKALAGIVKVNQVMKTLGDAWYVHGGAAYALPPCSPSFVRLTTDLLPAGCTFKVDGQRLFQFLKGKKDFTSVRMDTFAMSMSGPEGTLSFVDEPKTRRFVAEKLAALDALRESDELHSGEVESFWEACGGEFADLFFTDDGIRIGDYEAEGKRARVFQKIMVRLAKNASYALTLRDARCNKLLLELEHSDKGLGCRQSFLLIDF